MSDVRASTHLENNLDHPLGVFGYSGLLHALHDRLARLRRRGARAMW